MIFPVANRHSYLKNNSQISYLQTASIPKLTQEVKKNQFHTFGRVKAI